MSIWPSYILLLRRKKEMSHHLEQQNLISDPPPLHTHTHTHNPLLIRLSNELGLQSHLFCIYVSLREWGWGGLRQSSMMKHAALMHASTFSSYSLCVHLEKVEVSSLSSVRLWCSTRGGLTALPWEDDEKRPENVLQWLMMHGSKDVTILEGDGSSAAM